MTKAFKTGDTVTIGRYGFRTGTILDCPAPGASVYLVWSSGVVVAVEAADMAKKETTR